MALVQDPVWKVTFTFVDEGGSLGKTQLYAPAATTVAALTSAVSTLGAAINDVTGASLRGVDMNLSFTEDAPASPTADVLVEDRGQFVVLAGSKKPTYSIPGIFPGGVKPNGNIDTANGFVIAFMDALLDGPWTDSNGTAISRVLKAYAIRRRTSTRQRPDAEDVNFAGVA